MKYTKIKNVKSPLRANRTDAGIDFFVPDVEQMREQLVELNKNYSVTIGETDSKIYVFPHSRVLIPSGLKVVVPGGFAMIGFNKSGIATKHGLTLGACVVDADFRGEVLINLINTTDGVVIIEGGTKIAQFVVLPVDLRVPEELTEWEYDTYKTTNRGEGGFGSTGTV